MTDWLHTLADAHPADRTAMIDEEGRAYSHAEVRVLTVDLVDTLRAHGVRPGDRMILVCENCAAYGLATLAASHLQAWIIPVNARQTDEELRAVQTHSGARCVLFTAGASAAAAQHSARFSAQPLGPVANGLTVTGIAETIPEPVEDTPVARVAAMLYTTGTTSAPKGVMLTQANLVWNARTSARLRGMTSDDVVLAVLPGSHIFGFASTFLAALHAGSTVRFLTRFAPEAVLQALGQGASVMPAVPQMYERILTHLDRSGSPFHAPRLRYISAGGAPLDPGLKRQTEAVFGLPLHNGYGITETAPGVAATRPEAPRGDLSVGPPLDGVRIEIADPDENGIGEVLIESPGVMKGYYRDPQASTAALPRPGLFRSGDLGRIDAEGMLHILGRRKELIIRSGFNVYPPEVEAMLTRHADVLQSAVVGRRAGANEEILAFVMVRNGLDEATLRHWLRDRLVGYKRPQQILIVEAFPTAATGKILKHKLITHFADLLAARDASTKAKT
jgi:acyl-CoA synthetase (AMP-forming)/AMP-acid ligase II